MPQPNSAQANSAANSEEIRRIYAGRDASKGDRYAFFQPDVRLQVAQREWAVAHFLRKAFRGQLHDKTVLDVGCGKGGLLRLLANWGVPPNQCHGTELLEDRLSAARTLSPPGMNWHLGDLESLEADQTYDLVCAFTVFSSVLDDDLRATIARQMWQRVKPGGWIMVFDFRMNNPNNADVRKVRKGEMNTWWPSGQQKFRPLLLPPPLVRRIAPTSFLLAQLVEAFCPFIRSHFLYTSQKETDANS